MRDGVRQMTVRLEPGFELGDGSRLSRRWNGGGEGAGSYTPGYQGTIVPPPRGVGG